MEARRRHQQINKNVEALAVNLPDLSFFLLSFLFQTGCFLRSRQSVSNKVARVVVSGGFALAESEGVRVRISWTLGERPIRVLMWLPGWIQSADADCLLSATPESE